MVLTDKDCAEHHVFVYGTLRRGDCRFEAPGFLEVLYEEAYLPGYTLHDLGAFPGILPGPGVVRGEIHVYKDLATLDRIEGFNEKHPQRSLYLRRRVEVEPLPSEVTDAWVYVLNQQGYTSELPPIIESGDWFQHRGLYTRAVPT